MTWHQYRGIEVGTPRQAPIRRRYSVTADILSYQRCPRQYGYFKAYGYEPAHTVQVYFGTVVHQVLDRAHAHYKGLYNPETEGQLPSDEHIDGYFLEVDNSLRSRGIRAINAQLREGACELIKRFNQLEGPQLYPRVRETEHPIEADRTRYVLHGTVDVLADPPVGEGSYDQMEIWDYKGTSFPDPAVSDARKAALHRRRLQMYEYQMYVYAELYRARNGAYPAKAVLYFLNELGDGPRPSVRPDGALHEVPLDRDHIREAMINFEETVCAIEGSLLLHRWEVPSAANDPGDETCDICDIRWSCSLKSGKYPRRYP